MMRLSMLIVALMTVPVLAENVPEPDTYRGEPYKGAVPATLQGAQVIDAERAIALHDARGAVFIDVLPRTTKPDNMPDDMLWREPPHDTIPGAIWLWNTGYEQLAAAEQARLRDGLTHAQGDTGLPLVIFCRADCWMSWNAARRAIEWGFDPVYWFPGGVDDWSANGGAPLVPAEPVAP